MNNCKFKLHKLIYIFISININMYKYITLVLVIVVLYLVLKKKNELFSNNYTPNSVYSPALWDNQEKIFKYLNKEVSMFDLKQDKYLNLKPVPRLIFESYNSCPNLYNLFHSIRKFENGEMVKGEGSDGINFRNDCERIFYNASFFVRIEHPIIEIEGVDVEEKKQNMIFEGFELPNTELKLEYNPGSLVPTESFPPGYICDKENEIKQMNFGVTSDFTMEDILRFVDFSFTQLCFGMIYIEQMKLIGNHYRIFPSPVGKGSFFILPERIRHQVSKEGKYYTRAKCNSSSLNIIVLFGEHMPEKFDYIYPSSESNCKQNVITHNLDDYI